MKLFDSLDTCWAYVLLEELRRYAVTNICIASGARCLPLVKTVSQMSFTVFTHFDERSLGFFALGMAKATSRPVAIITTSGTAVANVLPAIIEAYYAQIPLIMISADRPWELHDCEANQSIAQESIFKPFVAKSISFPVPDSQISLDYLLQSIDSALFEQKVSSKPLHFNMCFRKPFFKPFKNMKSYLSPFSSWFEHTDIYRKMDSNLIFPHRKLELSVKNILESAHPVLMICGEITCSEDADTILSLAESLGACLLVDPLSRLLFKKHEQILLIPEAWIKSVHLSQETSVFWMGGRLISQIVLDWIKLQNCQLVRVSDKLFFSDASAKPAICLQQTYQDFAHSYQSIFLKRNYQSCCMYQTQQTFIKQDSSFKTFASCSYQAYLMQFVKTMSSNHVCMVSNSLPVRILNQLYYQTSSPPVIYANRGASGIDGVLSTAIGMAQALNQTIILFIGDMALMHDIGALYLLKQLKVNVQIICFNNGGGGIFSVLDLVKDTLFCDRFLKLTHNNSFEGLANYFGISYALLKSSDQVTEHYEQFKHQTVLLECLIDDDQTKNDLFKN